MNHRSLHIALPLAIFIGLAGFGGTIYGYLALRKSALETDENRFDGLVDEQMADITARLESYESVLYGATGLLNGSAQVGPEEWRQYVSSIPLQKIAPGILGVGTISAVDAGDRGRRIKEYQTMYGGGFIYKTVDGAAPPEDTSYIIDRIEPLDRNLSALGLDVGSEANRRKAYEAARDLGTPQVTGIITLVQDNLKAPGFLLIIPRYELGRPLDTVEDRRLAFRDVVYAPMIGKDVLALPSSSSSSEVAYAVYDKTRAPENLIYSNQALNHGEKPALEEVLPWPYAGREWIVHSWNTTQFVSKAASGQHQHFLLAGMTLSTLLASVVFMIHRSHKQALRLMGRYEKQAKENSSINDLFVEHAPVAIAIFDNDLCFLSTSKRWMKQFNLAESVIGRHHYDVFPEILDIQEWQVAHQRCLAGAHDKGGPDLLVREDGTTQYLSWEVHPWHRASGEIGGMIVFSLDVTEEVENRKSLEQARQNLAVTEERLRQATAAGNVGIWDWHVDSGELVWNDQMFDLFGVKPKNFSGHADEFSQAIHVEDRRNVEEAVKASLEQGVDYEIEFRTNRRDHPTVLTMGQVQRDADGKPVRMLGVCVDVSQQIEIRQELMRANEHHAMVRREAEQMVRAKEQFLATMSHEIRTPMNGMIGMSELLMTTPLDKQQKEFTNTIIDCGKSLLALVNDILDLSKIEAGRIQIEQNPFRIYELVDRVIRLTEPLCKGKGLSLEASIDVKVPRQVIGDVARLQQVLLNLVSNSIKFSDQGIIRIEVGVNRLTGDRVDLSISIRDRGVGMTTEEIERVFIPFVQADASTTRRYGGTGLGLSISRSLMLLMGGSLELESDFGKGTTAILRLQLPYVGEQLSNGAFKDRDELALEAANPWLLERVLIVEDNPINQRVTELQMKKYAQIIDVAIDGQQAVECFKEHRYDLILMDCQMPVMDGYDASRAIRKDEAQRGLKPTPIVALTANVYEKDRRQAAEAGMNSFLAKPLRMEALKAEMKKL